MNPRWPLFLLLLVMVGSAEAHRGLYGWSAVVWVLPTYQAWRIYVDLSRNGGRTKA